MKSTILSVGTELLFGQIINTNTVYLSQQLNLLGIDVMSHYTVGDNSKRLAEMIKQALLDSDLIITSGGLGPTQDDLTKEIVCEVLHDELVPHHASVEWLKKYFKELGREMTENNWKQAYFPSRAIIFPNDIGTAPGFALEENGKMILCMPGPHKEMVYMFENHVKPYLESKMENVIYYRILRLFGIGESKLETELIDIIDNQTDPTLATYAKEGECSVRVASKRNTLQEAQKAVEEMIEKVYQRVGEYIYSDNNEELYQVVADKLLKENISTASAESCTGGMFAQTITEIPGISAIFDRGLVTYSNRAKVEELGVKQETLDRFGAVSEETAIEMAEGLKKITGCRLCISVTGIAGPGGETKDKPVGLVYICAILDEKRVCIKSKMRSASRSWNRNYAKLQMFNIINKMLESKDD
ncbi:MAG: competence/damage-inducible protein A [Anaerovoracaceae bacterium]